jgi:antitoxin PrlF
MPTATVSDKGQVVIPAAIRRQLGIKPGTQLDFEQDGTAIRVTVRHGVPPAALDSGYGMLRARPGGGPRKLQGFDAADAMRRGGSKAG